MRSVRRGFKSFRRHPSGNLIVVLLLFVCLTFSLSMLVVKLAADTQVENVKRRVGNYAEVRVSSDYLMGVYKKEVEKGPAKRTREARSLSKEAAIKDRAKFMLPENVADTFARLNYVQTFDKVLDAGIIVSGATNSQLEPLAQWATDTELKRQGIEGLTTKTLGNLFMFEGNTNGASASDFLTGNKKLVEGSFFTYQDYLDKNPVVVVEKNMAEDNKLKVGDKIKADVIGGSGKNSKMELTVVGIYDTVQAERQDSTSGGGYNPAGNKFFAPLSVVQELSGMPGYVELGSYYFDNVDHTEALKKTFSQKLANGDKYELMTDWMDYEKIADPLQKVGKTSVIGLAGALGACALIILLAMAIIVISGRTRELGVLKALGATDRQVIVQYAVEVICICLVAVILATGATALISRSIGNWLLSGSVQKTVQGGQTTTTFTGNYLADRKLYKEGGLYSTAVVNKQAASLNIVYQGRLLLYGILILIGISLLGMAVPVVWITRLRPARVLSME